MRYYTYTCVFFSIYTFTSFSYGLEHMCFAMVIETKTLCKSEPYVYLNACVFIHNDQYIYIYIYMYIVPAPTPPHPPPHYLLKAFLGGGNGQEDVRANWYLEVWAQTVDGKDASESPARILDRGWSTLQSLLGRPFAPDSSEAKRLWAQSATMRLYSDATKL